MILKKISLNHFQCLWIVHCVFEILSFIPHLGIKLYFNCIYTQNLIILKCNTYTIKFTLLMYTLFLFVLFLLYFQGCSVITSICIQKMFISLIRKLYLLALAPSLKPPPPLKPLIYILSLCGFLFLVLNTSRSMQYIIYFPVRLLFFSKILYLLQ